MVCVCGHAEEEHGNDPKYPGSTACNAGTEPGQLPECDCCAFEEEVEEDEG